MAPGQTADICAYARQAQAVEIFCNACELVDRRNGSGCVGPNVRSRARNCAHRASDVGC